MTVKVDIEGCNLEDSLVFYKGNPFTGVLFSRYEDGSTLEEQEFENGLPHGISKEFYPGGQLKRQWYARKGRAEGLLTEFYENGEKKLEETREFGIVLSRARWDPQGNLVEVNELDPSSHKFAYIEECRKQRRQE